MRKVFNYDLPETELQESWFDGKLNNTLLVLPVVEARKALVIFDSDEDATREDVARYLRKKLEDIFNAWKLEHGTPPPANTGGRLSSLLGSPYAGKPIAECPPYVCAGDGVRNYAELLSHLRANKYEPLAALDEIGTHVVSATLVLSEAAAGSVESAIKAHWAISHHDFITNKKNSEMLGYLLKDHENRKKNYKDRTEKRPDQIDKRNFQDAVKTNIDDYPTKADAIRDLKVKPQFEKYTDAQLRVWLTKEVWSKSTKRGRPPKTKK